MGTRAWIAALFISLIFCAGCGRSDAAETVAAAVRQVLDANAPAHVSAEAWQDTHEFYARRQHTPAWVMDGVRPPNGDQAMRAAAAITLIGRAREHGLDPTAYGEQDIIRLRSLAASEDAPDGGTEARARALAETDVRITSALLTLGRDVALGRTRPDRIDPRWKARRPAPDFVGTLTAAADSDLSTWLDTIKPVHPQYAALQRALTDPQMAQAAGQIALNLERWRWMPDDLGARHIIVNIPTFDLAARDGSQNVLDMKVIVGTRDNKTPVFSEEMTTIVFSPYWNIPDSILLAETAPAAARDPDFLARNDIEILRVGRDGPTPVDPSTVDWHDPDGLKGLAFRQRPGPKNALGLVKFLLPNPYDVYLHDTPGRALFARPRRTLSHGCIRVEEPEKLARWVLEGSPEWTDEKIREAMHAGEEQHVSLRRPIPVHIVYFTAWADDAGAVRLAPDVYGYDAAQSSR